MATSEYYDRDLPDPEAPQMRPARATQQETYSYLRSQLSAAISGNLSTIRFFLPEVELAASQLERFKRANPRVEFRTLRPEDLDATDDVASRLVLR